MNPENYAVLGAGHGGKAMAAHLALMGFTVTLWNRTFEHIEVIKKRGGIELESAKGGPHGFGKMALVTSDMVEALNGAAMIMVVRPSSAHADIARAAAPHLRNGQTIVLHPGRTCGALEFEKAMRDQWILRQVVADVLPAAIANRPKAKFWQGSGVEDLLAQHAEEQIGDTDFSRQRRLSNGSLLNTREELLYYRIFHEHFGAFDDLNWMERTKGAAVQ